MKLMETKIPEIYSRTLDDKAIIFGANYTDRMARICIEAVSKCLGDIKTVNEPVAFVFKSLNGNFIVAARVEYHPSEEDPDDVTAGNWSYIWTYSEEDIKDVSPAKIITMDNQLATPYFITKAGNLYGIQFRDIPTIAVLMTDFHEIVSNWLDDNAKEGEKVELIADGVFKASAIVDGGEIVKSFTPEGDAKVIAKENGDAKILNS